MTATDTIDLSTATSSCAIAPSLGGAILRLVVAGQDVLRPAPVPAKDIQDVACFAMLPFANRVARGRFTFRGRNVTIGIDRDGDPHALHGHGWRRPWTPVERHDDSVTLAYDHDGEGWPWPYHVEQRFELMPRGIRIYITIENLHASDDMPAGVGIHPFFVRTPDSRIAGFAASCWRNDATGLAIEQIADDRFSAHAPCKVDRLEGTDNFFRFENDAVIVNDDTWIGGDATAGFHVYVPTRKPFFCVEPVSHVPNSFGRGTIEPEDLILPGKSRSWQFTLDAMVGT